MFEKGLKRLDAPDISLIKLSAAAGILFLITILPAAMDLVHRIHWGWFLGATIIFSARPLYKFFKK